MTHEAPQWILTIESGQALLGSTTAGLEPVGFRPVAHVDRRPQKEVWIDVHKKWCVVVERLKRRTPQESDKPERMVVAQLT